MADEAWYRSFVPGARSRTQQQASPKPNSLERAYTTKPSVERVDTSLILGSAPAAAREPPKASPPVRSTSFSEFHNVTKRRRFPDFEATPDPFEGKARDEREDDVSNGTPDGLATASHARYRNYLEQLRLSKNHLHTLLSGSSETLKLLSALSKSFQAVELQTSTFQARCEGIIGEQQRLSSIAGKLEQNLQYYTLLDPITRKLNAPGAGHTVQSEEFARMLNNMDHCLEYMQTHPHQHEAATYESRYRLLMTRGLTLIRVYFTNAVRDVSSEVARRIAERQLTDSTASALLYAKFRVDAPELKRLGLEIHKRALPPSDAEPDAVGEYQSLMNELYASYSAARGRLLVPLVRKRLAEIAAAPNTARDLVAFARASIGYIRGLCLDEYELWHEWFEGDGGLYDFLEAMCEPLFDYLRPKVIQETQVPKLCELCSIIQIRYMDSQDEEDEDRDRVRLEFGRLIKPALEDAQTRLVFLALTVLRDSIERYRPTTADLDVARKARGSGAKAKGPVLSGRKVSAPVNVPTLSKGPTVVEEESGDTIDFNWRYDTGAAYGEWYPTLRKAIWLLSKIYRLVNSTVFDDLAHRIVHQTTLSLQQAANQVATRFSPTDSQLFLLKQLLILKQQVVAFDIEFVSPEVYFDFSNILDTFWELRERGGLFDPRNLWLIVGGGLMPRVVQNMLDAKVELDGRLRTIINDFTTAYARLMTEPVSDASTRKKDFNAPDAVKALRANVERQVPLLREKLGEYLDDPRVRETLVAAVQDQLVQQYEAFFDNSALPQVSKKGKGREDEVWDPDTLADWSAAVFGVEQASMGLGLGLEDDGDGDVDGDDYDLDDDRGPMSPLSMAQTPQ